MKQSNKEKALSFMKLITTGKIAKGYNIYIHPQMKHHNAYSKGNAASLQKEMEENDLQFPNKKLEIQHSLEEGDLVAIHSKVHLKEGMDIATLHLFRFKDGLVIEMWDVGQQVPENVLNENGMF